jgi:hypothetical protein
VDDIISALKCASSILDQSLNILPCQVTAARKDGNPPGRILLHVTSDQRSGVKLWVQSLTILGKHQTRLQDYAGENKKNQRNNLEHHKRVTRKRSSIHPNFIGTCIM